MKKYEQFLCNINSLLVIYIDAFDEVSLKKIFSFTQAIATVVNQLGTGTVFLGKINYLQNGWFNDSQSFVLIYVEIRVVICVPRKN